MKTLPAQPRLFQLAGQLHRQVLGHRQHVVHQRDGIGKAMLDRVVDLRQARRHALLDLAEGLIDPDQQRLPESRL
ncbi:hypothetical protein D3C87_1821650 [compost metagenome]